MTCGVRVRARFFAGAGSVGCGAVRLRVHDVLQAGGGLVWRCAVPLPSLLPAGLGILCGLCQARSCRMIGLGNMDVVGCVPAC